MKVELYTDEIPSIFIRLRELIGESHWRTRVSKINAEIRGNRFLKDYLLSENAIAFGLTLCSTLTHRYGQIPIREADCRHIYPSMGFAAQILSIIDLLSPDQARKLVRRVHGALGNPDDMRALQLELAAATHFTNRGFSVAWPEMDNTGATDLAINGLGPNGLEVECKSISEDKGRKIHTREAMAFCHLLQTELDSAGNSLRIGLAAVLTVHGRLPMETKHRKQLAAAVSKNLHSGRTLVELPGANLRFSEFDPRLLGDIGSDGVPAITHAAVEQITKTKNRHAMIVGRKSGGAVVFVVQSSDDDTLLSSIFDTLSKSAKTQLSRTRAGLFLVGFHGMEADSLLAVAEQDSDPNQLPTALRQQVSKFLCGQGRDHVVGVGFISKTEFKPDNAGHVPSGGSAYIFPKKEGPFWHSDFAGLFS